MFSNSVIIMGNKRLNGELVASFWTADCRRWRALEFLWHQYFIKSINNTIIDIIWLALRANLF